MSKTVDSRVVEMQFDNRNFESNVKTSLSTLDKLKQGLKLDGVSKGLENVGNAAKNINLNPMSKAVETVQMKFSALEVMAVTALANITNSAVNAGKRLVSAFTIEPVQTGLAEYETQINAIQTILANTSKQGTTLEDVNAALDELNHYADLTIYNFTEMTRNIGTFTAAGLDLQTSTAAIQGIANLAAVSGSTSQQASTAMYQLSQALAAGTVQLMDWNSVVNASMGGKVFQDAIMQTVKDMKGADAEYQSLISRYESGESFRSLLDATNGGKGWFTSDILSETLTKFTKTGAVEYLTELYGLSQDNVQALQDLGDASGYNSDEFNKLALSLANGDEAMAKNISEVLSMASTATNAATEVKTFTQLMDTLKETAQSGWTQTWEIIFGDFNEAKTLFSGLQNYFSDIINGWSEARNFLLEGAFNLSKPWESIMTKLESVGPVKNLKKIADTVQDATDKLEYFQDIVTKVWRGDFNNVDTGRYDMLEQAGYDHRVVQDLVNKGYDYKLTVEDIEESHKKFGLTMETTSETTEEVATSIAELSDEQLKNAGLTEDEIRLYRDLEAEADRTGITIEELVEKMSKNDGRTMLIESFKNAWTGLVKILSAVRDAWVEIFPPMSVVQLYGIIDSIHTFSEKLAQTDGIADKIGRTFKGLFAILDLIGTVVGGGLKIAFEIVKAVLDTLGVGILDVTATIGDAVVTFRDWIKENSLLTKVVKFVIPYIAKAVEAVRNWIAESDILNKVMDGIKRVIEVVGPYIEKIAKGIFDWAVENDILGKGLDLLETVLDGVFTIIEAIVPYIKDAIDAVVNWAEENKIFTEGLDNVISFLGNTVGAITDWFKGLQETDNIPKYIIEGLVNGLKSGINTVAKVVGSIAQVIIDTIKAVLGIHSPSTETESLGEFTIAGFVEGLQNGASSIWDALKNIFSGLIDLIKSIDLGSIFAGALTAGFVVATVKIADAISKFSSMFEGIGQMFEGLGDMLEGAGKWFKGLGLKAKSQAILNFAIAIGILAAAVWVLSTVPVDKLWGAVGAIFALAVILGVFAAAMSKLGSVKDGIKMVGIVALMVGIAGALLIITKVIESLGGMSDDALKQGLVSTAAIVGMLVILVYMISQLGSMRVPKVNGLAKMFVGIAAAVAVMAIVIKMLGGLDPNALGQGLIAVGILAGIVVGLIAATNLVSAKDLTKAGSVLIGVAVAIGILGVIVALLGGLSASHLKKGLGAVIALAAVIVGLMAATNLVSAKDLTKVGSVMLGVAVAIGIMGVLVMMLGGLSVEHLAKGIIAVAALAGIIVGLMAATNLASAQEMTRIAGTLIAFAAAIGIMALAVTILGFLSIEHLAKGIIAVGLLGVLMAVMIASTKGAENVKGNIIAMTVAIGVMAIAVAALSFIDPQKLLVATAALAVLMGMFALIIKAGSNIQSSVGTLIVMTVAVGLLGGMLYLLAGLPIEATLGSAAALSLLCIALTASLLILSKIGNSAGQALAGVILLLAMAVPLLAFVGVLYLMEGLQSATDNVLALVTLAGALTLLLIPLTILGSFVAAALLGILALTAMAVPLLAFVGILALMEGLQNAATNIVLLTNFLTLMTGMMVILAIVGPLALIGVVAVTALVGLMLVIGVLATAIGALMTTFPELEEFLDKGIPIMEKLAYAIGSLVGNLIAGFTDAIAASLPGLGQALSDFMINAMPFIMGAKLVDDKVLAGAGILAGAAVALTVADVIEGIAKFLNNGESFSTLGTELSMFMLNATPFIVGAKMIDQSALDSVGSLVDMILLLTAANLLDSITSWITGESSLSAFTEQLIPFGEAMVDFSSTISGKIDTKAVDAAANAGTLMASLADKIPSSGPSVVGFFTGEKNLQIFGAQLENFGNSIVAFSTAVTGKINVGAVQAAANAGSIMAELANKIPSSGPSVVGFFTGEKNLQTFGGQISSFGDSIAKFSEKVKDKIDKKSVEAAGTAGSIMSELANTIPSSGPSVVGFFTGEKNLINFGGQLSAFGESIATFSGKVKDKINIKSVEAAANAGSIMKNLAETLPSEGGFLDIFTGGTTTLDKFGEQLSSFGESISEFSDNVADVKGYHIKSIVTSVTDMSTLASSLKDVDTGKLSSFGGNMVTFGKKLKEYYEAAGEINNNNILTSNTAINGVKTFAATVDPEKISTATAAMDKIVDMAKKMAGVSEGSTSGFVSSINGLAKLNISGFSNALNAASGEIVKAGSNMISKLVQGAKDKTSDVTTVAKTVATKFVDGLKNQGSKIIGAGKTAITAVVNGINTNKSKAKDAMTKVADACVQALKNGYYDFYGAGKYVVQGFSNGISANSFSAVAQAKAMANLALTAANVAFRINSPSKETYEMGRYFVAGFANSVEDYGSKVYNSAYGMAEYAKTGLSKAISKVKSILDSDMDAQPTIRPVLDLSSVESGVGQIDSMFGLNPSVGVLSNVRSINSMMNQRRQNGVNDEVVSAIRDLGSKFNKNTGDVYNVNGITYDDGSNISDAVKTLVRAARVERRT